MTVTPRFVGRPVPPSRTRTDRPPPRVEGPRSALVQAEALRISYWDAAPTGRTPRGTIAKVGFSWRQTGTGSVMVENAFLCLALRDGRVGMVLRAHDGRPFACSRTPDFERAILGKPGLMAEVDRVIDEMTVSANAPTASFLAADGRRVANRKTSNAQR